MRVAALYEPFGAPVVRADVASAEMVKLASNAFLATKISFMNEIANVCEETGADVSLVAHGMGLDKRIGSTSCAPGIGYGGLLSPQGRLGPEAARRQLGLPLPASDGVIEVNELQKRRLVAKLTEALGASEARRSPSSASPSSRTPNDMRDAPSLVLAPRLLAGGAEVRGRDPVALEEARTDSCGASTCARHPRGSQRSRREEEITVIERQSDRVVGRVDQKQSEHRDRRHREDKALKALADWSSRWPRCGGYDRCGEWLLARAERGRAALRLSAARLSVLFLPHFPEIFWKSDVRLFALPGFCTTF